MNKKSLKEFFPQLLLLTEEGPSDSSSKINNPGVGVELQNISLDQKVDKFMIQYERESLPQDAQFGTVPPAVAQQPVTEGGKSLKDFFKTILEADDFGGAPDAGLGGAPDMGAPGGDLGGGGDMGAPPDMGGAPAEPETPAIKSGKINIQNFAKSIARLVSNYETLCDPRTTILNRSRAYILKNYNENTAKELMIILEEQYNLTPLSNATPDAEKGPLATGAWSGGGGGGGGT